MSHGTNSRRIVDRRRTGTEGSTEEIADLLADPHCRYLLEYLRKHDEPATVEAITQYVVAEITDTPPEEVSGDVQRRVQTWLHHGQLPTLDSYGIVDFDADDDTVSLADDPRL